MTLPYGLDRFGLAIAVTLCSVAAISDLRTGKIYNWLTLPVLVVAPAAHFAWGGWAAAWLSIAGLVTCGLVFYVLFRLGGGGGDVKLMAAAGALVGPWRGLELVVVSLLAAAVFALLRAAMERKLWTILGNVFFLMLNPMLPRSHRRPIRREHLTPIRMGPAFFVGSVVVFLRAHPDLFGLHLLG